ncbi:MAG TPA: glucoamylase family protein [Tepidisphaeraceae bacterium]|nr:glucoamylase family protein [Tepidisphaeraceae bacterium]
MNNPKLKPADLEALQRVTFDFFIHETNLHNGLTIDKTMEGAPASIASIGFALSAYTAAVERGFMTRSEAVRRVLTTLRFFRGSPQNAEPNSTGYKGFYYHFLDMKTGLRAESCELSTIDTAFLIAGILTAASYFRDDPVNGAEIHTLADELYCRVDWTWALDNGATLTHGWKPESGFLKYRWNGYAEAMILYLLALGSPTFALPVSSYSAWTESYQWRKIYDDEFLFSGPLFTHQISHIWIDFRGIQDDYMRDKGIDYFENSRRATYVQREYAIRNPQKFDGYGEDCWGITASEGPGPAVREINGVQREFLGYAARGVPDGPDDGSISPWVVVGSLPFAPEIVLPAVRHFVDIELRERNPYGFKGTFNPTYSQTSDPSQYWVSPYHCGLNQGPVVLMIENYRSGLIWRLMRRCPHVVSGLRRAGFCGGWLSPHECGDADKK